ncbi:MAG: phage tail protein [Chloroflexi bacterium]|nr:phage tail protein [Chloroflexota bacterium]
MSSRIRGLVVGLVTDLDDPDGLGRIKVEYPWLPEGTESTWARLSTPLAGPELGFFFQPEIGYEALVAFEMEDYRRPIILGFLWNGDNAPPSDDPNVRMIQTVSGHKITLDDTSGSETITVEDSSGTNKIVMDQNGITIESTGDITLKGVNVTLEASSTMTIKGQPIHLNP